MTLPLMVRENSIIPMGAVNDRVDYEYIDDITLHVFEPKDGDLSVSITNLKGEVAATYALHIKGDQVSVDTDSQKAYSVVIHRG